MVKTRASRAIEIEDVIHSPKKTKTTKNQRDRFSKYIDKNYPEILDKSWFKQSKPNDHLSSVIKKIIFRLTVLYNKSAQYNIEFDLPLAA